MKQLKFDYLIPIKETVSSGKDFIIKGEAIHEITTRNGVYYSGEELNMAAPSLAGKPILKDHNNAIESIVGKVLKSPYNANARCIMFEGKIMDKQCQEMIADGRINSVSIGAMVKEVTTETINNEEVLCPKGISFVELSLVAVPADPNANFAQAMCESYKSVKIDTTVIETPKVEEKPKEIIIENIVKEEPSMAELEELKAKLEESNKLLESMKAEKIAQEKAKAEAEAKAIQEALKSKDSEIETLKKQVAEAIEVKTKGVVTTQEKADPTDGLVIERADSGKGFLMYRNMESLDSNKFKRLVR
jgi:hypothetical protein